MKQTAVEWLAEELTLPEYGDNPQWVLQVIQKAKEMEKEQHGKTYHQGLNSNFQDFEQYYKETFKSE
jgi:hypothetical protein